MPHTPPMIVIANHDTLYLTLMEELLTEAGYQVRLTTDPAFAYQMILSHRADLLIIDIPITNPDLAWTTLNMTLLNPVTQKIPILICSTDINFPSTLRDRLIEMDCGMIAKPFRLQEMLTKIQGLLGQEPDRT